MHGFISIDKPLGITSHDVVARIRRITRIKRVGHAGTLDPAASGVLVVAIGHATRLIEYVQDDTHKSYRALIALGASTDSDDATGKIVAESAVPSLTHERIDTALTHFTGTIMQVPPQVSALHVDGQRMYDLARQGIAPELPARPVTIYRINLCRWDTHSLEIDVECGKGTYIRALARDIGTFLGTHGHLATLRRIAVGSFAVEEALPLQELTLDQVQTHLIPPHLAISHLPSYFVSDADVIRIRHGLTITHEGMDADAVALCDSNGLLVAIGRLSQNQISPHKVFAWSD